MTDLTVVDSPARVSVVSLPGGVEVDARMVIDEVLAPTAAPNDVTSVEATTTVVSAPPEMAVEVAVPGLQGPAGAPAEIFANRIAAASVSGHRVMAGLADGTVDYCGSNHLQRVPIGVSLNAAAGGGIVRVQSAGEIVEPGWNWSMDRPVFAGVDGVLTQAAPDTGLLILVGHPSAPTRLTLCLDSIIHLGV